MKKTLTMILTGALLLQGAFLLSACGEEETSYDQIGTVSFTKAPNKVATFDSGATKGTTAPTTTPTTTVPATTKKATSKTTSKTTSKASSTTSKISNKTTSKTTSQTSKQETTAAPATTVAPTKAQPAASFIETDTNFVLNGKTVTLDENMISVLDKLGEPLNTSSAPSCHGDGEDKTYEYDGFTIYSYPSGGQDRVLEISVTEEGIDTPKGIGVGSTVTDMIAAYGNDFEDEGARYVYASGFKKLQFYTDGETINEVSYYYDN